ncbi:site-specific integrase [Natrinema sp. 1APR25-10V2]|nr:site-specific integrase [Natrinema sp. 1APR25-10V2]
MTSSSPRITPADALEDFNAERKPEVSASTFRNYQYPLRQFISFCNDNEIEYINDITAYDLKKFKIQRQNSGIKKKTLQNNLSSLRVFIRWCENAGLVETHMHEKIEDPDLTREDEVSDVSLPRDRTKEILGYLRKYEYATLRHTLFAFIWHTGTRMGTVRAIDLTDYHPRHQYIEIHHRPETETPLKNKKDGERQITLLDGMCDLLDDYIDAQRHDTTDEYGREPLFTTRQGRISTTTIRKNMYGVTRPCYIGKECPHGREETECDAYRYPKAGGCPSSVSPHPMRRSAITEHLNTGMRKEHVSERANVSVDILDRHYDVRTDAEKRMNRLDDVQNLDDEV